MTTYDAFISYSREDKDMMAQIVRRLRASDLQVWTDQGIHTGAHSWKREIEQSLLDSQCFICLLSPASNQSKWVRAELDFAELHEKPILLVLVRGPERDAIPFGYATTQWIDARHPEDLETCAAELVVSIREYIQPVKHVSPHSVEHDLTDLDTLIRLGNLSHYKDEHEEAIKYYSMALELDQGNPLVYLNRATSYADVGLYKEAIADYNQSIELDPENHRAFRRLARALRAMHHNSEAIEAYSKSIKIKPTSRAHFERGGLYFDQREFDKARKDYVETVALNTSPDLLDAAFNNIGECSFVLKEYKTALENFEHAIEITQDDYRIADAGKAITLYELGDIENARMIWDSLVNENADLVSPKAARKHFNWPKELTESLEALLDT